MKYRIGVVSELLGLSPEGLRLYERTGILSARRDPSSGNYRMYSHLDITALIMARMYHNCGFTMQETERLINTDSMDTVLREYAEKRDLLQAEIDYKQRLLQLLARTAELIESIPGRLDRYAVGLRPGMYRFEYVHQDQLILHRSQYQKFWFWVQTTPFTFPAQRCLWEDLCDERDSSISAMGILEEDASFFGIREDEDVTYYPPVKCLTTVVELSGEEADATAYLAGLRQYVWENGISVTGDPIARTILSMNKKKKYTRYRQVWLPIE